MPREIRIQGKDYEQYSVRGRAVAVGSRDRRIPGPGSPRYSLVGPRGETHPLFLGRWHPAVREGHELTAVWLVPRGECSGPYVAIQDHTGHQVYFNDAALTRLHRSGWTLLATLVTGALLLDSALGPVVLAAGILYWWVGAIRRRNRCKASGALVPPELPGREPGEEAAGATPMTTAGRER